MARYTSELAVQQIGSRYDLVLIGARRARELNRGWKPLIDTCHGSVVTALSEIEQGKIGRDYLRKNPNPTRKERPEQINTLEEQS
jgi:DNA-directed RNA polymerase subunit omega